MNTKPQDTRSELIEAALLCFSEHGYDGTSIRMIAQKAGRPLSLIGHHFGSKEGLYLEVFRFLVSKSPFLVVQEPIPPRTKQEAIRGFREQIHMLFIETSTEDASRNMYKESGRKLMLSEMRNPRPEILALLETLFQPWVNHLKTCIRVLRPDLNEEETIFYGKVIMSQASSQTLLQGLANAIWGEHHLTPFKSAELLTEFSLQGLGVSHS